MAETTEMRDQSLPHAEAQAGAKSSGHLWRKIRLSVSHAFFWSHERGTWQYDVIVLAILAFIFLSPRSWFQDSPTLQLTDLRHNQGVVEVGHGKQSSSYLVDARLVEAWAPRAPADAIQEILRERLRRPFTVKSIDPIRDQNKVVLGYTVVVVISQKQPGS
jgi:hypothetical protein